MTLLVGYLKSPFDESEGAHGLDLVTSAVRHIFNRRCQLSITENQLISLRAAHVGLHG